MPLNCASLLAVFNRVGFVPVGDRLAAAGRPLPLVHIIAATQYPIPFLLPSLTSAKVHLERGVSHDIAWREPKEKRADDVAGPEPDDERDDLDVALSEVMGAMGDLADLDDVKGDSDGSGDDDGIPAAPPAVPVMPGHPVPSDSLVPFSRVPSAVRDQVVATIQGKRRAQCEAINESLALARHHSSHPPIDGGIS